MLTRKTVGILTFLKGSSNPEDGMPGCANYDFHYGGCLLDNTCKVEHNKRCGYFEQMVLPTAADIGLKELVYSLYEKQVGVSGLIKVDSRPGRNCPDCGAELLPRKRYCEKCTRKRRQDAYRRKRQKKAGSIATVK